MQMLNKLRVVIGVTGASGSIYAKILLEKLSKLNNQIEKTGVVFTENAKQVWQYELNNDDFNSIPFTTYQPNDFYAPFASGSAGYDVMIVCPCTMGTMGRIAAGTSNDLLTRAADVMLKERKKLILVTRETPLSLIHINNMKTITEAGGIIFPASPSFYSKPTTIDEVASTVVNRVLQLAGFNIDTYKWGEGESTSST